MATPHPLQYTLNLQGATITNLTITDRSERVIYSGNTPTTLRLKSGSGFFTKASYKVKFDLEGFEERIFPIHSTINGWYFGNIWIGGVLGLLIIDPSTGAMWIIKNDFVDEKRVLNKTILLH